MNIGSKIEVIVIDGSDSETYVDDYLSTSQEISYVDIVTIDDDTDDDIFWFCLDAAESEPNKKGVILNGVVGKSSKMIKTEAGDNEIKTEANEGVMPDGETVGNVGFPLK